MEPEKKSNKRENTFQKLAEYFLSLEEGARIKSIRNLAHDYHTSIGLISECLNNLEESGAIKIDRRGQLGSFLSDCHIGKIWNASSENPLVISHTLPSNRRYEGLATALKKAFSEQGIESYFIFIRGSKTRLNALRENRCHIAIMSQFAAEGLISKSETIALTLEPGSFVKSHQVFFRPDLTKNEKTLEIAVDTDSYDQTELSKLEFKDEDINCKKITFMNIRHYLLTKIVDMAIWTEEDMENHSRVGILNKPLSKSTLDTLQMSNTRAALIIRSEDTAIQCLIPRVINKNSISRIQRAVISGKIVPEY